MTNTASNKYNLKNTVMKSKILTFFIVMSLVLLVSCTNDSNSIQIDTINGSWNLTNISEGLAGIDDDYDTGIIKWIFDSQNLTLTVENNNLSNTIYDGFESGIYMYSILEINGNSYLLIEDIEFGGYTVTQNNLMIDQNEISTGSGADGFVLRFER